MAIRKLISKITGKGNLPAPREERDPFSLLQGEMNRLFDEFSRGFSSPHELWKGTVLNATTPRLDVEETDKEVRVTAELPGMDETDIEVSLSGDTLTLSGEKKQEKEDKGKNFHRVERSYGSFHRSIHLPAEIQREKAEASFKKGVLTVTLPKTSEAREKTKKIEVKGG